MSVGVVLDPHRPRLIPREVIASAFCSEVARGRNGIGSEETLLRALSGARGIDVPSLAEQIAATAASDTVHDSEEEMVRRAMIAHLPAVVGMTGWVPGYRARGLGVRLTGSACPRCKVNPTYSGIGGGSHCLNVEECGWWFCY